MKKRTKTVVLSAPALAILLTTLQPSSADTLYPIAISGQPAPDGNGVFATGFAEPTLNNRGVVCFYAIFTGSTGNLASSGICCGIQPPFPRAPVRPNGSFRGLPQKTNSLQSAKVLAATQ